MRGIAALFVGSIGAVTFVTLPHPAEAAGPVITGVSDNGPVARYAKLEVSFTLGTTYANPYDPSQIDAEVVFSGPGGAIRVASAFWYQAYARSGDASRETLTPSGSRHWTARIAPHLAGNWTYRITARDAGGTSTADAAGPVSVEPSGKHGFLRASGADPRYFAYDDGTVYLPLGENIAWAYDGRTYQYDQWLGALAAQGGNFARVWMAPWDMCAEWDRDHDIRWLGNYDNHQPQGWELDHVLDTADANRQAISLVLIDHDQFSSIIDPNWQDNIYNRAWGGPLASPDEVWTDVTARDLMMRRWRYLVARYSYSTALLGWELWNEMEWTDNYGASVASSAAWHQQMSDYIRAQDPHQHLITTSYAHALNWGTSVFDAGMDIVQTHYYGATDWAQFASDTAATFRATYPTKPFLLGEFGLVDDATSVSQDPGGLSIAEVAWSLVMSKASSGGAPWWWDGWVTNQDLYGRWKGISTFLAGEDLDRRAYAPVRPEVSSAVRADVVVVPAFNDFAKSPASSFTLTRTGDLTPPAGELARVLQGSWKPALRNPPTFQVDFETAGLFKVVVSAVAPSGNNRITIRLDGAATSVDAIPVTVGSFVIGVPPGTHSILVDSTGDDWFLVSDFDFIDSVALLRSFALDGTDRVLGWVQSRNYTYWNQCPSCQGGTARPLPTVSDATLRLTGLSRDGEWQVTFHETTGGTAQGTTSAIASGGALSLPLPAIATDLAFKLSPGPGVTPTLYESASPASLGSVVATGVTSPYDHQPAAAALYYHLDDATPAPAMRVVKAAPNLRISF